MTLILIRHGQTEYNLSGTLQGSLDSPLTAKGIQQAHNIGKAMAQIVSPEDYNFFVSPQGRAIKTAQIMLSYFQTDIPFELDDDLKEVNFGDWEGKQVSEIINQGFEAKKSRRINWAKYCKTGESLENGLRRSQNALNKYMQGNHVLVSHGATISMIRGLNLNIGIDEMMNLPIDQSCYWVLERGSEKEFRVKI